MGRTRFNSTQTEENSDVTADVNETTETDTNAETIAPADGTATTPARTVDPDRGNIGDIEIEDAPEDDTWGATSGSNSPLAQAVASAVKGQIKRVKVDDDTKKIERVKRMLRAAAQRNGVGMNINPTLFPVTDENGDTVPGKVYVKYRTADRLVRPAKAATTEGTTDAPAETPAE